MLCNDEQFNPSTHVCCDGNLINIVTPGIYTCCGTTLLHDPTETVCCEGHIVYIHEDYPNREHCCGFNALYDQSTEICCGGNAVTKRTDTTTECCLLNAYDPVLELCCDVQPKSATLSYNGTVKKDSPLDDACCGVGGSYNTNTEICCDGHVVAILDPLKTECCGQRILYNTNDETCCEEADKKVPRRSPTSSSCCGNESFDEEIEICCSGHPVLIGGLAHAQCCGAFTAYDISSQRCCGGTAVTKHHRIANKCCGTVGAYFSGSQICCDNNSIVWKRTVSSMSCCGAVSYDENSEVCCNGNPIEKRTINTTQCCGDVNVIDANTETCCGGFPIDIAFECCDTAPFDPFMEVCCSGIVQSVQHPHRTECCGDVSFDATCRMCDESGSIVLAYDEDTHMCCDGVIHEMVHNLSCCCGQEIFDASQYECCYGQVRPRHHLDESRCCRK